MHAWFARPVWIDDESLWIDNSSGMLKIIMISYAVSGKHLVWFQYVFTPEEGKKINHLRSLNGEELSAFENGNWTVPQ